MQVKTYGFIGLTGGGTGYLDAIDGSDLEENFLAFGFDSGKAYTYRLDATSGLPESPPQVITPNLNAGDKRWILQTTYGITGYPDAGLVKSTGSGWDESVADNSDDWDEAFSWGDHAGLYAPIFDILEVAKGGTGLDAIAAGSILAANSEDTLSAVTSIEGTKVLTNTEGSIGWAETDPGTGMVYPDEGIAVSTGTSWDVPLPVPEGEIVGTSDEQELSNKTFGVGMTWPTFNQNTTGSAANLNITGQSSGDILYYNGSSWVRLTKDAGKYLQSGPSAVSWVAVTGSGGGGGADAYASISGGVITIKNVQTGAVMATGTNSATVFNTVIDTLTGAGGGKIYASPGTYNGGAIVVKSNIILDGAGKLATVFTPSGNNDVFQLDPTARVITIKDLGITDLSHHQTNTSAINIRRSGGVDLHDRIVIQDLYVNETFNGIITGTPSAYDIPHSLVDSKFDNLYLSVRGTYGLHILNSYQSQFNYIQTWYADYGMAFDNGGPGASAGHVLLNCENHLSGTAFYFNDIDDVQFLVCLADTASDFGYWFGGSAQHMLLLGAEAWMETMSGTYCAYIDSTVGTQTDWPITFDSVKFMNGEYGIYSASSSSNFIVQGGQLKQNTNPLGGKAPIGHSGVYGVDF